MSDQDKTMFDWRDFYFDMEDIQLDALLIEWREIDSDAIAAKILAEGVAKRANRHARAIEYEQAKRKNHGETR